MTAFRPLNSGNIKENHAHIQERDRVGGDFVTGEGERTSEAYAPTNPITHAQKQMFISPMQTPGAIISFTQCSEQSLEPKFALYSPISLRLESTTILLSAYWRYDMTSEDHAANTFFYLPAIDVGPPIFHCRFFP
ncbi:hypothetical protein TNCV_1621521 [Trichonephila clavipes]|nr:hypothetical protein TNCV_1621521 [Trichonephila clavipes]